MKKLLILIPLFFTLTAFPQRLKKFKPAENIVLKLPADFVPMTPQEQQQRYQSPRLPLAMYTDAQHVVDFGINRSYALWDEKDIELMRKFYEASILELFDKVRFLNKGIANINGRDYAFFEFESIMYAENKSQRNISKYTYIMYTVAGGTTYVFNFTCPVRLRNQWQGTARKIMQTIKIKA